MTNIELTRRDDSKISLNPDFIVSIEDLSGPKGDTKLVMYSGAAFIVKEKREAILALIDKGGKK